MRTFLKRVIWYIFFWVVIILVLEWLGYLGKMIDDYSRKVPAHILIFSTIGYLATGAAVFMLAKRWYKKLN